MINVGVIGLGHVAIEAHIPALRVTKNASLVAAADIDERRLKILREKMSSDMLFTDYRRVLELDSVDMVIICLPPLLHGSVTLEALKAGKHVLVEKPLTTDLAEAVEIAETSLRTERKVCVVQNFRYICSVRETKNKIVNGAVGKLLCVNTVAHVTPTGMRPWLFGPRGILEDFGPHPVDMTNWLISSVPSRVFCSGGALERATSITDMRMMVTYEDGPISTIGMSWLAGATKFEVSVMGTGGELALDVFLNHMIESHGAASLYYQTKDSLRLAKKNIRNMLDRDTYKGTYVYHPRLIDEFVESIEYARPLPIRLGESLQNIAVSEGAKLSMESGKVVALRELSPLRDRWHLLRN